MAANDHTNSFAEFIDDYFSECEEHLILARQCLLALDAFVDRDKIDQTLLDDLFRSFHSLKGLSAMVGVRAAEQLAHEMESYLVILRKGDVQLAAHGLDLLIGGVKSLEEVIAARRAQVAPPSVEELLVKLAELHSGTPNQGARPATAAAKPTAVDPLELAPEKRERLAKSIAAGARAWLFTFTPSSELSARGVNVNVIRQRLENIGDLLQAAPRIGIGGKIAFTFIVATSADQTTFAPWREEGLVHEPFDPPQPAPEPKPVPPTGSNSLAPSNLVRVDLGRLDELMRLVGELVISRARLDDNLKRLGPTLPPHEARGLQETNLALERQLRDLREGVMRVRMVPVRELFARMQFVIRDLTREHQKKVTLQMTGQDTEIDKFVVERMMDPFLHLVRNAVAHALEPSDERVNRGKPPEGVIALRARATGETITMEVEDDGRGIDPQKVYARARSAGLVTEAHGDGAALLDILCAPGFSTRDEADRVSGRGVGMAVVRSVVEELGGSLSLRTEIGKGTCFTIQLPLTLAIADALIVLVAGERYAVPQVSVREVIEVEKSAVTVLENNEIIYYRGGVLPLLQLGSYFQIASLEHRGRYVLVTGDGLQAVGLAVDRVLGLREVVVRPLTDVLVRVPGISGATELGDGRVVLILDAAALARAARLRVIRPKAEIFPMLANPIVAAPC